jgi:hypothetical protein
MAQFKLGTWQVRLGNTVTVQTPQQHAAAPGHTPAIILLAMRHGRQIPHVSYNAQL